MIYAAGSVAKCANHLSGHATVAGAGPYNAARAGQAAALNMVAAAGAGSQRNYNNSVSFFRRKDSQVISSERLASPHCSTPRTMEPLPIWRSDQTMYLDDDAKRSVDSLTDQIAKKTIKPEAEGDPISDELADLRRAAPWSRCSAPRRNGELAEW